jgi:hypothetical protein
MNPSPRLPHTATCPVALKTGDRCRCVVIRHAADCPVAGTPGWDQLNRTPKELLALTLERMHFELLSARNRHSAALGDPFIDAKLSDLTAELFEAAWHLAPDLIAREGGDHA